MTNQEFQYPMEHLEGIQKSADNSNSLLIEEIFEPKNIGIKKSKQDQNTHSDRITTEESYGNTTSIKKFIYWPTNLTGRQCHDAHWFTKY